MALSCYNLGVFMLMVNDSHFLFTVGQSKEPRYLSLSVNVTSEC